ncbi:hypothetical protein [Mycobacterium phage WXIN]|nr:hypothetical protein [Mycobacterium phage WXIN]
MLSRFDQYQQALITAFWALSDAQPPKKSELRAAAGTEHLTKALYDVSKASGKYQRSSFDWGKVGTTLPGHRQIRASVNKLPS